MRGVAVAISYALQARLGALDQHLEPDAPDLEAHVLLDLRQQPVDEAARPRGRSTFGDHHDVDVLAGRLDDLDDVAVEELGADVVRAERADLALEVQRVERLDERLARFYLLRDRAGVLEIEDHLVGFGAGGLGHHLERVRRAGELGAADAEVASDDELIVIRHCYLLRTRSVRVISTTFSLILPSFFDSSSPKSASPYSANAEADVRFLTPTRRNVTLSPSTAMTFDAA